MSNKNRNICSLVLNALNVVFVAIAIAVYYFDKGDGNMLVSGNQVFRYFTNDSNILSAVCSAVIIFFNVKNIAKGTFEFPRWACLLKFVGTVSVSVTFLVVVFFLGPVTAVVSHEFSAYFLMFDGYVFFLHFLCPVLAIVSFAVFERKADVNFKWALLGEIPTILYGTVYFVKVVICTEAEGGWPDFYYFNTNGRWYFAVIAMLVATYVISLGLSFLNKKLCKEQNPIG